MNNQRGLNRREFLRWSAMGTGAALLAACAPASTTEPAASEPDADASAMNVGDSGAELPSEDVSFRWIDSGDQKAVFWNEYFAAYEQAHPNISVEYDALPWNEIAQVVPLGVRNGTAHDVFQIPLSYTPAQAVSEGWAAPLNDIIPNFEEWKAAFPEGVFTPGITDFDGVTYNVPITSNKRYGTHLLYNVDYLQEAGYDPSAGPLSVDEFLDAARKITENGAGQYYGFIMGGNQVNRWGDIVGNFARMAGASSMDVGMPGMDMRTGEFIYTDPLYIQAVEVLFALRDDGSVFPGTLSINAPEARARMPQGAAGMILQGPWNIPIWQSENPDFNFDVSSQPLLDPDTMVPITVGPGGANQLWVYADAPDANKTVAGDILHYIGSIEGQRAWASVVGAADGPVFSEALEGAELSPVAQRALQMFVEQVRVGPTALVRNPEVSAVNLELQPITPNFSETVQGLYTEQINMSVEEAMQDLQDRANAELDRAIEAAQDKGADVSREDYVFPNWDPTQDYATEDYDTL